MDADPTTMRPTDVVIARIALVRRRGADRLDVVALPRPGGTRGTRGTPSSTHPRPAS